LKLILIIIFFNITSIIFPSNQYIESTQATYKPLQNNSLINLQVAFYNFRPSFGAQWWVSDNLQLSGIITSNINDSFNLYNNICIGYYNQNINWLYSSSSFIGLAIHKIKYDYSHLKWINLAYKSRYNYQNIIIGYDINHCFWKDIENNFISLVIGYNIKKKVILELKSDIDNNDFFTSFNFSVPL